MPVPVAMVSAALASDVGDDAAVIQGLTAGDVDRPAGRSKLNSAIAVEGQAGGVLQGAAGERQEVRNGSAGRQRLGA